MVAYNWFPFPNDEKTSNPHQIDAQIPIKHSLLWMPSCTQRVRGMLSICLLYPDYNYRYIYICRLIYICIYIYIYQLDISWVALYNLVKYPSWDGVRCGQITITIWVGFIESEVSQFHLNVCIEYIYSFNIWYMQHSFPEPRKPAIFAQSC